MTCFKKLFQFYLKCTASVNLLRMLNSLQLATYREIHLRKVFGVLVLSAGDFKVKYARGVTHE